MASFQLAGCSVQPPGSPGVIPALRALSHAAPGSRIHPRRLKHREKTPWQLWGTSA